MLGVADSTPETLGETSPSNTMVTYWETGVANPDRLLERQAESIRSPRIDDESDLLGRLLEVLDPFRFQETVLITPSQSTLRVLRARLAAEKSDRATLRGFSYVPMEETLREYFGADLAAYDLKAPNQTKPQLSERDDKSVEPSDTPRRFYEVWASVYRLLPPRVLQGDPV